MEVTLIRDTQGNVTAVNVILSERNLAELMLNADEEFRLVRTTPQRFLSSLHRTVESGLRLNVHIETDSSHYAKREPVTPRRVPVVAR